MLKSENNTGIYFFSITIIYVTDNKNRNDPVSPHTIFANIC
jgi:hypothetical protein